MVVHLLLLFLDFSVVELSSVLENSSLKSCRRLRGVQESHATMVDISVYKDFYIYDIRFKISFIV